MFTEKFYSRLNVLCCALYAAVHSCSADNNVYMLCQFRIGGFLKPPPYTTEELLILRTIKVDAETMRLLVNPWELAGRVIVVFLPNPVQKK